MGQQQRNTTISSTPSGMYMDSLLSLQPDGTYREAWSAMLESDEETSFGISNEPSNELLTALPGNVRGLLFVEERDEWVVFIKGEKEEIGIISEKAKRYVSKVDTEILKDLNICDTELIDVTAKVDYPCGDLWIYWSSGDEYFKLNLDDPCCEFEQIRLLKCTGVSSIVIKSHEMSGILPNGKYGFAVKQRDGDGNDTNWYPISKLISVAGGDYRPGEPSGYAINIELKGGHQDYNLLDIAVVSIVDGITSFKWVDTVSFGNDGTIDYLYHGDTGREVDLQLDNIITRSPKYFMGKNLFQHDGRLYLYNIKNENNLDYQRQANEIDVKYTNYVVPTQYAHQFSGLRPNEQYIFGIRWNYCDGTHSTDFHIPGRAPTEDDLAESSVCEGACNLPKWRVGDTSNRLNLYLEDVLENNDKYNKGIELGKPGIELDVLDDDEKVTEKNAPEYKEEDVIDDQNAEEDALGKQKDCQCEIIDLLVSQAYDTISANGFTEFMNGFPCPDDCAALELLSDLYPAWCECQGIEIDNQDDGSEGSGSNGSSNGSSNVGDNTGTGDQDDRDEEDREDYENTKDDEDSENNGGRGLTTRGSCSSGNGGCGISGVSTSTSTQDDEDGDAEGTTFDTGDCDKAPGYDSGGSVSKVFTASGRGYAEVLRRYSIMKSKVTIGEYNCLAKNLGTEPGEYKLINTGNECYQENRIKCMGSACEQCIDGTWHYIENATRVESRVSTSKPNSGGFSDPSKPQGIVGNLGGTNSTSTLSNDFSFEYIYDEDGCTIIGVKPKKYSDGVFGYWETQGTYPDTENCDCEEIYGDLVGKNIRLHRVPSVSKEPFFMSFGGSVPNMYEAGNEEDKDSFSFFISPSFNNITPPDNLPKPLNEENPFTITYMERTEANKSVLGSGVAISCFLGDMQGTPFAFPKNGVNSFEFYDRSIEPLGDNTFRGGTDIDKPVYVIHSPDFHMRRPPLDSSNCLIELELYGKGFRHGLYAEGQEPDDPRLGKKNQRGARQSVVLDHFRLPKQSDGSPVFKCTKAMSYVDADTIVAKSDKFEYPLCNLWRESSVYVELEGNSLHPLHEDIKTTNNYGGASDVQSDGASDRSFTGDTIQHEMPIHEVRANYVTFTRYLPNQYGSVIAAPYIPLGIEGDADSLKSGEVEDVVGDSYSNTMSVKRTSYISDKTPRKLSYIDTSFGIFLNGDGNFSTWWNKYVGGIFRAIGRSISYKICGTVPKSGDEYDYKNVFGGLRDHGSTLGSHSGEYGETSLGNQVLKPKRLNPSKVGGSKADWNLGDNYFPQVLKTNMFGWYNADVNLKYRQKGSKEAGEVYYKELKGMKFDSSMPFGQDWNETFMNRFYGSWDENARWRRIAVSLILFLFVYGIGIFMMYQGLVNIATGFGLTWVEVGIVIGASTGPLQVAMGIGLWLIGMFWMAYWAFGTDRDNKAVEEIVGLKNCRYDVKNPDNTYSLKDGRLHGFENNYWEYDNTHSFVNRFEVGYGMGHPYNTCVCKDNERSMSIRYSNKQNLKSSIDSWSNFQSLSTIDVPTDHGKIQKMFKIGNDTFIHTTDMIISLQTGERQIQLNKDRLLLGSSLDVRPLPLAGGVTEGHAGTLDPNAGIVTQWGYLFPDRESRQLFMFNGQNMPSPISDNGVRGFLQENGGLRLLEQYPHFKLVDLKTKNGIGFSIGIDHQHSRILFTKRDFEAMDGTWLDKDCMTWRNKNGDKVALGDTNYFCDRSFTLSYDPHRKVWVSFHHYTPHLYAFNRFNMFSFDGQGMWKHNEKKGHFGEFYGCTYPFSVETITKDPQTGSSFKYISSDVDVESNKWKDYGYIRAPKTFFNEIHAYNSHQSTGILKFKNNEDLSILKRSTEDDESVRLKYNLRRWNFSELQDHLIFSDEHIFDPPCTLGQKEINEDNHSDVVKNNKIEDNFLATIFTYYNEDNDTKMFLKNIRTDVDIETLQ